MSNARHEGALEAYRAGRYEDAIQQFLELLHEDPLNPELHASLGDSYRYSGQVDNANWHYQQVFKLSDDPELISYAVGAQVPSASETREKSAKPDRSSEAKPAAKGVERTETSDRSADVSAKDSTESDDLDKAHRNATTPSHLPSPMHSDETNSDETNSEGSSKPATSSDISANPRDPLQPQTKPNRQKQGKSDRSAQLHLKIVGLAIALAAIPVTAVGITAYYSTSQSLRQEIKRSQEYKVTTLSKNLHRFLLNQYENAKMLGVLFTNSDTSAKSKPRPKLQLQNRLNLYKQAYRSFDGIAIFEPSGKLVAQSSGNSVPSTIDRNILQRVIRGNTTVIAKPTAVEQTYVIDFAAPITDSANQRVELVIQARMTLPYLLDVLGSSEANNFFVVNADGTYVLATDTNVIGKDAKGNYSVLKELLATNSVDTKEASLEGGKKLLSYAPPVQLAGLPDLNWRSLTSIDENKALAPLGGLLELCLMGAVLALILVGAIAYFISRLSISRIRTAKHRLEGVLTDRAQRDTDRDDLEALLADVDEIVNLQDLYEQQKLEGQYLQQQRMQLFRALQKLAQVDTTDLQISNESISFLVEKIQAQLNQGHSTDISTYLQQLTAQQHADREGRQQQTTAILNTIQELNRSNSEAIAQMINQTSRSTAPTGTQPELRDLTISDRNIDAIAARLAQFNQTGAAPNPLISGQSGQEISDLVLQLIEQQRAERNRLQQQTTEILHAIQALDQVNAQQNYPQEPQEITISDRSITSLAERVQAQLGQRDISEMLLQLVEQQQAEQEKLQQQSTEILGALQALSQSNAQLSDRLHNQFLEQSSTQLGLASPPSELTVSEASINSLVERVQAQIAQPEVGDRLQALQQLMEQQYAERQNQQSQTTEVLSAMVERVKAEVAQPEVGDRLQALQELIEQQHIALESSQQQSAAILNAIQQLEQKTREPVEPTISDRSIDLLASSLQSFPLQTSAEVDKEELEAIEQIRSLETTSTNRLPNELSEYLESELDNELDELEAILQLSQPDELPTPASSVSAPSGIPSEQLKQAIARMAACSQRINAALRQSEQATAQISADAIRQVDEINYTITSLQDMAASIQSAVDVADQVASAAQSNSSSALTSNQVIEQSAEAIALLRATIAATAKKVKHLGESSQHISKVSALISEVAVRTNYLAINASLEASRAGSNGRGFTNIAEEVGELATRSAAASKEIEELIDNIQADSGEVINFMELGTTQVVECTQLVEAAKQNLQQIVIASQQINQLAEPIAEFTASQTANSGAITNLIQDIAQISQRTTRSSQQLNQSLQDTAESLQQLRLTVSQLELEQ